MVMQLFNNLSLIFYWFTSMVFIFIRLLQIKLKFYVFLAILCPPIFHFTDAKGQNWVFLGILRSKSLWSANITIVKHILFWKHISNAFQRCMTQVRRFKQSQLMIFSRLRLEWNDGPGRISNHVIPVFFLLFLDSS